jgi:putative DNA methylase
MFVAPSPQSIAGEDFGRAIESPGFPFEALSDIAERESWRKEINRPIYHLHKWWAQRLGSVFRSILIGALAGPTTDIAAAFYHPRRLLGTVVFDPFMGSGTTVGEALKLGARAIGRDINPVSYFIVKAALAKHPRAAVEAEFKSIERDVSDEIRGWYRATGPDGQTAHVLYYFWIKVVRCPQCSVDVDLFSNYLFVRNAYVRRRPLCRVVCPYCGEVSSTEYGTTNYSCSGCQRRFNPMAGPAGGANATCPTCDHQFSILKAVKAEGDGPPRHRMYAKLILSPDGTKSYLRTTIDDERSYAAAAEALQQRSHPYPVVRLADGHNTQQAIKYGYHHWHEFFNGRQLLCLSILADRIRLIEDSALRDLFTALFSGVLEFNNMFASFKGEGTGAVRHMFSHHILKPERAPLEANPWGTPKSSGSFSTLFRSRVLRAIDYQEDPFEVGPIGRGTKEFGLSRPLGHECAHCYRHFDEQGLSLYLSCGDSSQTDLPDRSVDVVVTDPPFFDNVHYSELADFFYVWQQHILGRREGIPDDTTRSPDEVQSANAEHFASRLGAVWRECCRVLRDDGVMIFTYHHSRPQGWRSVLQALLDGGFVITAAQPIKSEMSVAAPKSQAKDPIDLDIIFVCRKRQEGDPGELPFDLVRGAIDEAEAQVARFSAARRRLSRNDVRVIVMSHALKGLTSIRSDRALDELQDLEATIQQRIERIHGYVAVGFSGSQSG